MTRYGKCPTTSKFIQKYCVKAQQKYAATFGVCGFNFSIGKMSSKMPSKSAKIYRLLSVSTNV